MNYPNTEKLYLMKNTGDTWLPAHEKLMTYISAARKTKINIYKFDKHTILSLNCALLVKLGISELLNCPAKILEFDMTPGHKPFLKAHCHPDAGIIDFSLSHTENAVLAGIVTNEKIGVDIEKVTAAPLQVMSTVFHPEEINYINDFDQNEINKRFFTIWTKKEAYTKCTGTGLVCDITKINVLDLPDDVAVITESFDDYIYSVCTIKSEI